MNSSVLILILEALFYIISANNIKSCFNSNLVFSIDKVFVVDCKCDFQSLADIKDHL